MKVIKFRNGTIALAEKMTIQTSSEVETEIEVEFAEKDAEDIRKDPFAYGFEFDDKGELSKVKKGNKTIKPKKPQNI